MSEKLKQLYQELILQHHRHPVHFEKREDAGAVIEAYNPICGDRFQLYLDMADEKIARISFYGYGCAISKAATSVLVSQMDGQGVIQAAQTIERFLHALQSTEENPILENELAAFLPARQFPERMQCVTLSWEALKTFLAGY
ncbi:MAG TPA: SUF system NifU family Fe-S cluster assembly protein [Saprospiraceae bacterium]|nr:SUF system NifU family Fe-S cluster assembly protein [Saprospiraceae bacterium]HMQ83988.1 SUF system NifU family Fe-S cluster assembly protein [Saprospiraceae bacterium]